MNKTYKTLVIEDELPARQRLVKLLENFKDTFNIIDVAKDGVEGKEKIETLKPDLIFLDIEMPGLNGFEMLKQLNVIPIVIFCTAYDQYALQAFETNSIDYLLKPVSLERLQQSANKLHQINTPENNQNILEFIRTLSANKEAPKMTSITIKKDNKLLFVKLEEVTYFQAEERYVLVHTKNSKHITEVSLTQLEQKLPNNFLRVHRSIIINTNYVKEVQKHFNSRFVITLNDLKNTKVTSGRSYNDSVKQWINL